MSKKVGTLKETNITIIMSDIGFSMENNKAFVHCAGQRKELPRESLLEIYQLTLGHLVPNRDYSSVTSVRKLRRIVEMECEPDESDDESEPEPEPEPEPKKTPVRPRKAPVKAGKKAPAKSEPEESSEAETSDDSD